MNFMITTNRKYVKKLVIFILIFGFLYYAFFSTNSIDVIEPNLLINKLNISIFPPDHLDGIRLEKDGDINMDYMREILFGIDHHLVSSTNKHVAVKTIKKLFYLNDKNHDKMLDQNEVYHLISNNIEAHIEKALQMNRAAMNQLKDPNTNLISWNKYVLTYLLFKSRSKEYIDAYLRKLDNSLLSPDENQVLENAYRQWVNADIDGDNHLNEVEYLGFLHPELNSVSLNRMCDKILMHLDKDNDGRLTEDEFVDKSRVYVEIVTPYPGYVISDEDKLISTDQEATRRKTFKELIDTDHDGIGSRVELLEYINPRNKENVYKDALEIIKTIDSNSDAKLTLTEMIQNYQKVINSKLVNIAAVFHNSEL